MVSNFLQGAAIEYGDNKLQRQKAQWPTHCFSSVRSKENPTETSCNGRRQLRPTELLLDDKKKI